MPGARAHFKTYKAKNPNTGGGCLCSPDSKVQDCLPPYCVGTHKEQFVSRNPFVVIGSGCIAAMGRAAGAMPEPEPVQVIVQASVDADDLDAVLEHASVAALSAALHDKLTATDVLEPVSE